MFIAIFQKWTGDQTLGIWNDSSVSLDHLEIDTRERKLASKTRDYDKQTYPFEV